MSTPEIDRPNGDADDGMGINKWLWQPRKGGQIYLRFRYRDLDGKSVSEIRYIGFRHGCESGRKTITIHSKQSRYNGLRRSQGQLIRRIPVPPPMQKPRFAPGFLLSTTAVPSREKPGRN